MTSPIDHPFINQRYFFPRHNPVKNAFMVDCGDAQLACYYHRPHEGARTLVHFHGNGETVGDYLNGFAQAVEQLGLNIFFAEYRGYGGSTGTPTLGILLDDVKTTVEALGLPPQELILFGRSVGSLYAVHGASVFPDIAGLILESGVADSMERILMRARPQDLDCTMAELEQAVDARLNHEKKLNGYTGPTLVMHTLHDDIVDISHGERLHAWAGGPKKLVVFEDGVHNNIMSVNAPAYFAAIKEFAQEL